MGFSLPIGDSIGRDIAAKLNRGDRLKITAKLLSIELQGSWVAICIYLEKVRLE
jgi:hypothetical protein